MFGDRCRNLHVEEECTNLECDVFKCDQRHPRTCTFWREYRRCKFSDYCRYRHAQPESDKLNENLKVKIVGFEKVLKEKDLEIKTMQREIETNNDWMILRKQLLSRIVLSKILLKIWKMW